MESERFFLLVMMVMETSKGVLLRRGKVLLITNRPHWQAASVRENATLLQVQVQETNVQLCTAVTSLSSSCHSLRVLTVIERRPR